MAKKIIGYHLVYYGNQTSKAERKNITYESKTDYIILEDYRGNIILNRNAQRKLYLLLGVKFDKTEICCICKTKRKYSDKYDAYYCPKCLNWLERICSDRNCGFCKNRPKYPKENQK
jgi:hypothetical protein